jgi:glucokinase
MKPAEFDLDGINPATVLGLLSSHEHVAGIDVGGTRFRGWLATRDRMVVNKVEFNNADLASLTAGLVRFLLECGLRPGRLCLGVTGDPHADGTVYQPNVPTWWPDFNWMHAASALGIDILPMNDMGIAALGAKRLNDEPAFNYRVLTGMVSGDARMLVVGFGTGLGDAFIEGSYIGQGESGHQPFSPRDEVEDRLLQFSREELGDDIVSFEDMLSGSKGLPRLYRFYNAHPVLARQEFARLLPEADFIRKPTTQRRLALEPTHAGYQRPAEVIMETGLHPGSASFDPISFLALVATGTILGTYAGARGVAVCALGGIKLTGGVLSRDLLELWRRHSKFEHRVRNMGVHNAMAARFQVDWVTHPYPGLVGAIEAALVL